MRTRIFLVLAVVTSSACSMDLGLEGLGDPTLCGFLFDQRPCVGLAVGSTKGTLLKGDTMRVYTMSDSGFAAPVAWSITGAAEIVGGSEADWPVLGTSPARSILIRGLTAGSTTITATHTATSHHASTTVMVADSIVVTRQAIVSFEARGARRIVVVS